MAQNCDVLNTYSGTGLNLEPCEAGRIILDAYVNKQDYIDVYNGIAKKVGVHYAD